ncbi:MAG: glycerol-3-phosphate 1-O-acyltransferase PlsY [Bacillota bacterium]
MNPGDAGLFAIVIVVSYFLGSVPFGFLAARIRGVDITKKGSGNTGATNVLRTLGPAYAVPVLLLDAGKGALSAYLGLRFLGMGTFGALVAGAAAISGHNWSVFLKFRGGKGVAASAGVVLVAFPMLLAVALGVFVLTVVVTKYVSLGSILGAWAAFLLSLMPGYTLWERIPVFILVALITYQHRSNIGRLLAGTENKIGQKGGATR